MSGPVQVIGESSPRRICKHCGDPFISTSLGRPRLYCVGCRTPRGDPMRGAAITCHGCGARLRAGREKWCEPCGAAYDRKRRNKCKAQRKARRRARLRKPKRVALSKAESRKAERQRWLEKRGLPYRSLEQIKAERAARKAERARQREQLKAERAAARLAARAERDETSWRKLKRLHIRGDHVRDAASPARLLAGSGGPLRARARAGLRHGGSWRTASAEGRAAPKGWFRGWRACAHKLQFAATE